ncbi:MAG: hypothetical protein IPM18_04810 [Phycisphaerales bacterium]|nr:hypothetical protein [Phycisphaerales bacterium]
MAAHGRTSTAIRHQKHATRPSGQLSQTRPAPAWVWIPWRLAGRVRVTVLTLWRRIFQHRNHVFVFEGPLPPTSRLEHLRVVRVASMAALPDELRDDLVEFQGPRVFESLAWEFERGGVLWLGVQDGRIATVSMSRRGCHFVRWFVPLDAEDLVIFRNKTRPEFRGQRLNPALMFAALATELRAGGRAFIDCKVYNHASIRSIERSGFRRIATLPPLKIAGQFRFDVEQAAQRAPHP